MTGSPRKARGSRVGLRTPLQFIPWEKKSSHTPVLGEAAWFITFSSWNVLGHITQTFSGLPFNVLKSKWCFKILLRHRRMIESVAIFYSRERLYRCEWGRRSGLCSVCQTERVRYKYRSLPGSCKRIHLELVSQLNMWKTSRGWTRHVIIVNANCGGNSAYTCLAHI